MGNRCWLVASCWDGVGSSERTVEFYQSFLALFCIGCFLFDSVCLSDKTEKQFHKKCQIVFVATCKRPLRLLSLKPKNSFEIESTPLLPELKSEHFDEVV